MDFFPKGFNRFAAEAATALNRAVQFTEERLGHGGERTELDGYLENLLSRAEQIRCWTEKLVACTEAVLQPNPGSRVEYYLIEKLAGSESKRSAERLRNLEALGSCMLAAGRELTPAGCGPNEPNYGNGLVKCGKTQLKIGQFERELANKAERDFVRPLKRFLDEDAKELAREKRALEARRLDLDAAKGKYKKARSQHAAAATTTTTSPTTGEQFTGSQQPSMRPQDHKVVTRELGQVESELKMARHEFDKQVELVTRLCNKIIQFSEQHAKCLSKLVEAQAEYYQQSNRCLEDLLKNRPPEGDTVAPEDARSNSTGFASLAALSDDQDDLEPA